MRSNVTDKGQVKFQNIIKHIKSLKTNVQYIEMLSWVNVIGANWVNFVQKDLDLHFN